ncbi:MULTISPECIES: flagellin [Sinorhizobium]|uniref:Flagellin n=2 Tax=Sinorhizobium TaxID=28105 RepID=C3MG31_SINFN|nr:MULTISPECIES: flagellin [Sinorhizobium]ACP24082.1 flagellin C protein [Sinorhizobium fredii NGR234]APG83463.1 flagellin A [Sinorhizobium americanum CCGM7]APG89999.1 flagellin A [Sinorhizobium americanum]OAP42407.1 flagellin [Sinorhizobium americanum]TCN36455.1 flagellin [Sinorhizobium americanum]
MASILTNSSATAALQTLRSISSSMEDTQNRISTGMRVGSASDNAAYWSIATTMRSDNAALSSVTDALGMGAAKVDTAYAGMEAAIDVVKEIKAKIVAATEEGVDGAKVQEEIDQLQDQLLSIAESASFNGENWIAGEAATKTVVTGFVRASDGTVSIKTSSYTLTDAADGTLLFADDGAGGLDTATGILGTAGTNGNDVYGLDISAMDATALGEALSDVEDALTAMTSAASSLGSMSTRIDLQADFVSELSDSIENGIGRLVDADMNEESTRLKALQTQQQLAIQALSIANSDSQNILSLFR